MKNSLKTALVTFISLGFLSGADADAAYLKSDHAINDEFLRLEHVFDGLEAHHDYVLSPAPKPGEEITLNAYTLNQIATSFGLKWQTNNPYEDLTIQRNATVISPDMIEDTLKEHIADELHMKNFRLKVSNPYGDLILNSEYSDLLTITSFDYNHRKNRFKADVKTADGQARSFSGVVEKIVNIPVLNSKLRSGDIISKNDITWIEVAEASLSSDTVTSIDEIIGLTPRRYIYADGLIKKSEVQAPIIVKKGEQVTMSLASGKLNVTAKGRALDNGAKGDTIRILNKSSNRIIEAKVVNPQEVEVSITIN